MEVAQDKVSDSLRGVAVGDLSVDVLPALANHLELTEGSRNSREIEAKLGDLAEKIDIASDKASRTQSSDDLTEVLELAEQAKVLLDLIDGNAQEQAAEVVNFKPWEQLEVSRDANNNFKLNFDNSEIDTEVLQQALRDKGVELYLSDSFRTALNQGLEGDLVIVTDSKVDEANTARILEENGLSSSDEPKAELLTTMLVYYLKDLSGLELSSDERELLNLFDNRESSELSFVRSGSSSFGVIVNDHGDVRAYDGYYGNYRGFAAGRLLSE